MFLANKLSKKNPGIKLKETEKQHNPCEPGRDSSNIDMFPKYLEKYLEMVLLSEFEIQRWKMSQKHQIEHTNVLTNSRIFSLEQLHHCITVSNNLLFSNANSQGW